MIWIDVSDAQEYFLHCKTVTGIQRVVVNIVESIIKADDAVRIVAFDEDAGFFHEIHADEFLSNSHLWGKGKRRMAKMAGGVSAFLRRQFNSSETLLSWLAKAPQQSSCDFRPGDSLLFLGAFWQNSRHVNRLIDVSFSNRLQLHVLVHDIIPLSHKAWFSRDYVAEWQGKLERLLRVADGIFVNSMVTASTLGDHLTKAGIEGKPIKILRFGDPIFTQPASPRESETKLVTARNFVLMVSSIDVRKNQMALLCVWNRLVKEHGDAVPDLVLVGKDSTGSADIHAIVAQSKTLSERVKFVQDADDAILARYYEGCLFTVFPSFAEGWGFPVAESLMFGKACIASNATSIPEVGGTLCRYVDPHDLEEIYRAIEAFIFDEQSRDAFTQRIAAEYKRTTWASTAESVIETILVVDDPINIPAGSFEDSRHA